MTLELESGVPTMERATAVASRVLAQGHDLLPACRDLARLRQRPPGVADEIMDTFVAVASEVDDLPIGGERVRAVVEDSLSRLLMSLSGRH